MEMTDRRDKSNPTTPARIAAIAVIVDRPTIILSTRRTGTGGIPADCETNARTTPRSRPTPIVATVPQKSPRSVGELVWIRGGWATVKYSTQRRAVTGRGRCRRRLGHDAQQSDLYLWTCICRASRRRLNVCCRERCWASGSVAGCAAAVRCWRRRTGWTFPRTAEYGPACEVVWEGTEQSGPLFRSFVRHLGR